MAIVIPSKNIYGDIDNPKVAENAIGKIEISDTKAQIVTTNENTDKLSDILSGGTTTEYSSGVNARRIFPTTTDKYMFSAGVLNNQTLRSTSISLKKIIDDYYISSISPTIEVDYDVTISTVRAISYIGQIPSGKKMFDFQEDAAVFNSRTTISDGLNFSNSFVSFAKGENWKLQSDISVSPEQIIPEWSVIDNSAEEDKMLVSFLSLSTGEGSVYPYKIDQISSNTNEYSVGVSYVEKITIFIAQDYDLVEFKDTARSRPIEAYKIEFVAKEARIVYNETIKYLAEEEKTEILSQSGSSGEEVLSVAKNSLIKNGSARAMYDMTLEKYSTGKEIATLRCSVGEYYDDNGSLVISTKTPNKMLFEHYDKVVPMVRSASGVDVPMSVNSEGNAKVFDVVGVREIYDGAILQELTLREHSSVEIPRTTYRTYVNKGGGLTYEITSSQVVTEINSAGGITYIIGE